MAQLDAEASSDDDVGDADDDEEEGGQAGGGVYKAEVARAREEMRHRAEQRREAISRAVEREDRKKAEHDIRRAVREQAGHTNAAKPPGGRGGSKGGDAGKGDASKSKGGRSAHA